MSSALEIDGKTFHPIKDAVREVSYSRDYLTRLAREKKIVAQYVGRQWFVDLESLKTYVESAALEQEVRKRQLSDERKRERQLRVAAEKQHTLHLKRARTLEVRAMTATVFVLGFGLLGGLAVQQWLPVTSNDVVRTQLASTHEADLVPAASTHLKLDRTPAAVVQRSISDDVSQGVLLLPQAGTANPEELFSDAVVVRELPNGSQVVQQVDAAGQVVGDQLPFVVVPVEKENN